MRRESLDESTSVYYSTSNPPTPVSGTTAAALRDWQKGAPRPRKKVGVRG